MAGNQVNFFFSDPIPRRQRRPIFRAREALRGTQLGEVDHGAIAAVGLIFDLLGGEADRASNWL